MTRPDNTQWEFGPFRLDGEQHLLLRDGEIVPLSRKATDMLIVLLEHRGQLVEKEVLLRRVWPDSFVEESNLAVHISQLRKTLSEENALYHIETVPRRGYRFVGELNGNAVTEPSEVAVPIVPIPQEPVTVPLMARKPHSSLVLGIVVMLLITTASVVLYLQRRAAAKRRNSALYAQAVERERLMKEVMSHQFVSGDLIHAVHLYEDFAAAFPDDVVPRTELALIYSDLGKFGLSVDQGKAALRIAPGDSQNYASLASHYIASDSLNLARDVIGLAASRKLDSPDLHLCLYEIAFLQHDESGMAQQVTWSSGKRGSEDLFLADQAKTLAFQGEDIRAAEFTARAIDVAQRVRSKDVAAGYRLEAAQREVLFGNPAEAKRLAAEALALDEGRDTKYGTALVLALAGSVVPAQTIAKQLNNDFPDDTFVQYLYLPAIHAAVALEQKDPARAAQVLEASTPYELGVAGGLMPVYVRGLAYLAYGDSPRAEVEFQKVIANPGVVLNSPIGPLSRLQLARAYALEGDHIHAKAAYQDFLTRWKDADPMLPILRAAQAEYAKQ